MSELTFTLSEHIKPVSANVVSGMHHMELHRMAKAWKREAYWELVSQRNALGKKGKKIPLDTPVKLYITYLFSDTRGRDDDNYSGGCSTKWLIDTLKGMAWDGDDTSKEVMLNASVCEGMEVNETLIRIVEMEGHDE